MSKTKIAEDENANAQLMQTDKKRKRSKDIPEDEELEIDVNLPEPPSKKAKRKDKKKAAKPAKTPTSTSPNNDVTSKEPSDLALTAPGLAKAYFESSTTAAAQSTTNSQPKTDYGIWIGNLPFSATNQTLRDFLQDKGDITGKDVVRLHLPNPREGSGPQVKNRGFAYIDFPSREIMEAAIGLSETLIAGRRCLIKDAKNFEGRPTPKVDPSDPVNGNGGKREKEPTKRVFIGNLGFDVTKDDIRELFGPAGEVEDVFLATFEDSGKCKGFGWVTFNSVAAAEVAVKGYYYKETLPEDEDAVDGADDGDGSGSDDVEVVTDKKVNKPVRRKIWINRLQGRTLRCEFAEDATTRYKKRYGKDKDKDAPKNSPRTQPSRASPSYEPMGEAADGGSGLQATAKPREYTSNARKLEKRKSDTKPNKDERRDDRRKRHDARTIAPGKALAGTPRASGAIVAGTGKKMSFG